MNPDPDERAQPEGGAAPDEFDAIVAAWQREGQVPVWPGEQEQGAADPAPGVPEHAVPAREPAPPAAPAPPDDDDHFVPPEPPPLPRIGPPALVGLVLLGLGLLLIVAPGWIGVPQPYGLPLGLLGLASGLGWLVLRLWPDPPDSGGDGDGAVV